MNDARAPFSALALLPALLAAACSASPDAVAGAQANPDASAGTMSPDLGGAVVASLDAGSDAAANLDAGGGTATRPDAGGDAAAEDAGATTRRSIFLGGDIGFQNLTVENTAGLLASGRGGIYTHGSAIGASTATADQDIWKAFAPYGGGIFEAAQNTFFDEGNAYDTFCKPASWVPQALTLNLAGPVDGYTASDLAAFRTWVDAVRSRPELAGISVAPFATPGGADDASSNPLTGENGHVFVETDGFWGQLAQAALYGEGIAVDAPVGNFLHLGEGWPEFLESQIKWGNARGIRTVVVLSPVDDSTFVEDVEAAVAKFQAAGAVPTEWDVENYGQGAAGLVAPGGKETTAESLNAAALWLAQNAPVTARAPKK